MATKTNDHDSPAGPSPEHQIRAHWVPGPLERPIRGDDDDWTDAGPDDQQQDQRTEPDDCEQDDRRHIIRLGGNGF